VEHKSKIAFIGLSVLTCLLLIILNRLQTKLFVEEIPLDYLFGICIFLFAYELSTLIIVNKKVKTDNPRQIVTLYMLLKGVKIFLFLAALVIYVSVVKIETKRFVLVAVALYFIYLLFDTFFLMTTEKKLKRNERL
jgi:hypothetical protein